MDSLSRREQTIACQIVQGKTSKMVARELGISPLTVRKHRENILRKLGIRDTMQLAILLRGGDGTP
ncbi:helix-turn-helix transcriptional regulator [[Empedobacter] haloabium]|uniref:Helix-turn-helix transcriptional regulator n=1 Tax=[Empedobacter] haloabium TaxID=592317 RepID=A0ABZ1UGD0_9BURK